MLAMLLIFQCQDGYYFYSYLNLYHLYINIKRAR